jgi:hypothetical protein
MESENGNENKTINIHCNEILVMPRKRKKGSSFWDGLFKIGAVIGGAWLSVEIFKWLAEAEYYCPNCNYVLDVYGIPKCPNCEQILIWDN